MASPLQSPCRSKSGGPKNEQTGDSTMNDYTFHIPSPDELLAERPTWETRRFIEKCLEDLRRYYKQGGMVNVPIGDVSDAVVFSTIEHFENAGWDVQPRN